MPWTFKWPAGTVFRIASCIFGIFLRNLKWRCRRLIVVNGKLSAEGTEKTEKTARNADPWITWKQPQLPHVPRLPQEPKRPQLLTKPRIATRLFVCYSEGHF